MDALISGLLKTGAPWGILCAVLLFFVIKLWFEYTKMADKLFSLAENQIKVSAEIQHTLGHMEKNVDEITRKFKIP